MDDPLTYGKSRSKSKRSYSKNKSRSLHKSAKSINKKPDKYQLKQKDFYDIIHSKEKLLDDEMRESHVIKKGNKEKKMKKRKNDVEEV